INVKTRSSFIERERLLKEGDAFDSDILEESERNLRRYSFLGDVKIDSKVVSPGRIDLFAHTEDQWTTRVNLSAGKSAGFSTFNFSVDESNFLGLGKTLGVSYNKNPDRSTYGVDFI